MMAEILYFTGVVVWSFILLAVFAAVIEVLNGMIVAISWMRFVIAASNNHGIHRRRGLIKIFFSRWWHFIGFRKGGESYHGPDGYWKGVGDWSVKNRGKHNCASNGRR